MEEANKFNTLKLRMKYARDLIGVNQTKMAELIGIKPQTIQSIESGRTTRTRFIMEIAKKCRVDPIWLATGAGEPRHEEHTAKAVREEQAAYGTLSKEAAEIAMIWSTLPTYRRQCLRDQLFMEAAVSKHLPWLSTGKPNEESYNQFEKRVEAQIRQLTQRTKTKQK